MTSDCSHFVLRTCCSQGIHGLQQPWRFHRTVFRTLTPGIWYALLEYADMRPYEVPHVGLQHMGWELCNGLSILIVRTTHTPAEAARQPNPNDLLHARLWRCGFGCTEDATHAPPHQGLHRPKSSRRKGLSRAILFAKGIVAWFGVALLSAWILLALQFQKPCAVVYLLFRFFCLFWYYVCGVNTAQKQEGSLNSNPRIMSNPWSALRAEHQHPMPPALACQPSSLSNG